MWSMMSSYHSPQFKYVIFHIVTGIENYSVEDFFLCFLNLKQYESCSKPPFTALGKVLSSNGLKILAKKKKKNF